SCQGGCAGGHQGARRPLHRRRHGKGSRRDLYIPDQTLFVFDVEPPRQYVGAAAYRKDWQAFLDSFNGPITFELTDLDITTDDNLAYSHSIQRVAGTDKQGKKLDLTVRVTDVYKKISGNWLVIHEHVSVPVDLDTG